MPILNIATSLIFLFLLYSLLATSLKEGLATILGLRARMLERAIVQMLNNDAHKPVVVLGLDVHALWKYLQKAFLNTLKFFYSGWFARPKEKLHELFYEDTIIRNFAKTPFTKPSYISAENFSRVIVDLIHEKDISTSTELADKIQQSTILDEATKKIFIAFLIEAGYDVQRFRNKLEGWFNDTMDRVSGWYKREAQLILFMIGLTLAFSFNIDIIHISKTLSADSELQTAVSAMATEFSVAHKNDRNIDSAVMKKMNDMALSNLIKLDTSVQQQISDINSLLGLGWTFTSKDSCKCVYEQSAGTSSYEIILFIQKVGAKLSYIFGCSFSSYLKCISFFLFAIGISLGSPFWFDLLNNLVNLRAAGKIPPEKTAGSQVSAPGTASVVTTINQNTEPQAVG